MQVNQHVRVNAQPCNGLLSCCRLSCTYGRTSTYNGVVIQSRKAVKSALALDINVQHLKSQRLYNFFKTSVLVDG